MVLLPLHFEQGEHPVSTLGRMLRLRRQYYKELEIFAGFSFKKPGALLILTA